RLRRLDEATDAAEEQRPGAALPAPKDAAASDSPPPRRAKRREYPRQYLRWLRPVRSAIAAVFFLALIRAGLEMVEPLFMRFIVDRVLLNKTLDAAARFGRL